MSSDINFVDIDAQSINDSLIKSVEEAIGETLYPADERRLFLQQLVPVIMGIKNDINNSARMNLLRYATGEILEALGEFDNTYRLEAVKSTVKCRITLSEVKSSDVIINKGTRITPDGVLFFALKDNEIIPKGQTYIDADFEATEPGKKFNDFATGQIKNIVDPIAYIESIINIESSSGGSDEESDDSLRERIRLAPESFSVAGPEGAYKFLAQSTDVNISDIAILSPSPGTVRIVVLMNNGTIPSSDVLDKVLNACNQKNKRPLTDRLEVTAPTIKNYDINLTYYIDKEHEVEELKFRKLIEGSNLDCNSGAIRDFINWQQDKLGRAISPDELRYRIQSATEYKTIDNRVFTAVRRITLTSPLDIVLAEGEVAKVGNITVTYGGLA